MCVIIIATERIKIWIGHEYIYNVIYDAAYYFNSVTVRTYNYNVTREYFHHRNYEASLNRAYISASNFLENISLLCKIKEP